MTTSNEKRLKGNFKTINDLFPLNHFFTTPLSKTCYLMALGGIKNEM